MKVLFTGVLTVVSLGLFVFSIGASQENSANESVLAATTITLPEVTGVPSPNILLKEINSSRIASNLEPVSVDPVLTATAQERIEDMRQNKYYAHQSPVSGLHYYDLLESRDARVNFSCENLNLSTSATPNSYVNDWLKSRAGHKECMLSPSTTKIGAAIAPMHLGGVAPQYVVVTIYQE